MNQQQSANSGSKDFFSPLKRNKDNANGEGKCQNKDWVFLYVSAAYCVQPRQKKKGGPIKSTKHSIEDIGSAASIIYEMGEPSSPVNKPDIRHSTKKQ